MKTFLATLIALIVLALAGGGLFIYSGLYNIAASEPHLPLTRWVVETTREQSVRRHAAQVVVPPAYGSADRRTGFRHYREMCLVCHGAPGVERSELARGLLPEPPELHKEAQELSPAQIYWTIAHGLKMTGMPAFGESHSEADLWALTAFVEDLPQLSPEQWRTLDRSVAREAEGGSGHGHEGHAH